MKKNDYVSKAGLKARGWTDSLINQFLPECDREARNPHYACAAKMKLYSLSKVESIEASDSFTEALGLIQMRKERRAQAAIAKKCKMADFIHSAELGIPEMGREELLVIALTEYNNLYHDLLANYGCREIPHEYSPLTLDSDPVLLAGLANRYLWSQVPDLTDALRQRFGEKLLDEGLSIFHSRATAIIDNLYPWIGQTVKDRKRFLFLDTETTGLSPLYDDLVQVAWSLTDEKDMEITSGNFIIKPDGFTIPASATRIHGITTNQAIADGAPLKDVIRLLAYSYDSATNVVGHNIGFDIDFISKAASEVGVVLRGKHRHYDTAEHGTTYCKLPSSSFRYRYRTPSLTELHQTLFGHPFDGAHDAMADAQATRRCFWGLMNSFR